MKKRYLIFAFAAILAVVAGSCKKGDIHKTLIVTGQSEHNWKASYPVLKQILEGTGLFTCDVVITPEKGNDMSSFKPAFSKYKLVVLDYSGDSWPEKTKQAFVEYVRNGGGVVVYHGASISFPDWKEYNEITGLGGWNNRNEKDGPYVYYDRRNQLVYDTAAGPAGSHGDRLEFEIRTRVADHPITKGLPARWMHGSDELYQNLRGPAKNMQVLATASTGNRFTGGGKSEPMMMVINYGQGRVYHSVFGHADEGGGPAMQCVGFIITFQRGAEWAATGNVTQAIPYDFPTAAGVVLRPDFTELNLDQAFENLKSYDIPKSTRNLVFIQSRIKKAAGNVESLLELEKRMVDFLKDTEASNEAKKLILRELSWMGTEYSVPAIRSLESVTELKDEVEFTLTRLQANN